MRWTKSVEERLFSRLTEVDGCWIWGGASSRGYGHMSGGPGRGTVGTHRLAWEFFFGPVPPGLDLDHLCRTPLCANPWHLEPVSKAENARRAHAGHSHC